MLSDQGWYIKDIQNPAGLHFAVTNNNINSLEELLNGIKAVVNTLERMQP